MAVVRYLALWSVVSTLNFAATGEVALPNNWRGVHLWLDNEHSARRLVQTLPALSAAGANVVVVEVNYSYEFGTHSELRNTQFVSAATAHALAAAARTNGIRLIPEFNCLGHQSFNRRAAPLLREHPDFNETPSQSATNAGVYCLSWCPRAPGLNDLIFSLIDEIAEGFEAESVHVGMDEVYFIGEAECPRCRGAKPAELFAAQVNSLHEHLAGKKKWQMLMWADRIVGPKFQGSSRYDNPHNDLSAAIDLIPKDILMCDWHYEWKPEYPSIAFLAEKGFRIWPAGFMPLKAAQQLSEFALAHRTNNVVGYLATTWNETSIGNAPNWPPVRETLRRWRETGR